MTKADLIDSLATDFELSKRQTGEIIDALLDEIKAALRAGDKVQLIPFGASWFGIGIPCNRGQSSGGIREMFRKTLNV